jgi:hypothetical protein
MSHLLVGLLAWLGLAVVAAAIASWALCRWRAVWTAERVQRP